MIGAMDAKSCFEQHETDKGGMDFKRMKAVVACG